MTQLFNIPHTKNFRRMLRGRQTYAEQKLWSHLKQDQLGVRFRRQFGIGIYIVDFYVPKLRLIIEIDGDTHFMPGSETRDKERQTYLESLGMRVLRFTNTDITYNVSDVVDIIKEEIKMRHHLLPSLHK